MSRYDIEENENGAFIQRNRFFLIKRLGYEKKSDTRVAPNLKVQSLYICLDFKQPCYFQHTVFNKCLELLYHSREIWKKGFQGRTYKSFKTVLQENGSILLTIIF